MAEGTNTVLCKYLLSNACSKGSKCEFSHDRHTHRPSNVCQYYIEGKCTYGSACRYDHDKSSKKSTTNAASASKQRSPQSMPSPKMKTFQSRAGTNKTTNHFTTLTSTLTTSTTITKNPSATNQSTTNTKNKLTTKTKNKASTTTKTLATFTSTSATSSRNIPTTIKSLMPLSWALAPEFKPKNFQLPSYSTVVQNNLPSTSGTSNGSNGWMNEMSDGLNGWMNERSDGSNKRMSEGTSQFILCEFCSLYYNPSDPNHQKDCERAMERHRRKEKVIEVSSKQTCGICLDIVWQKETMSSQRFGLLSGCNHVFCLECIRTWRRNNSADDDALRSCPECRTHTDFVVPSYHWFVDQEDKERIIKNYKTALKTKACKYFKQSATCPFGDDCFYSHKDKNGKEVLNVKKTKRYKVDESGESSLLLTNLLSEFIQIEEALREYVDDIEVDANDDDDSDYGITDDEYAIQIDQELTDILIGSFADSFIAYHDDDDDSDDEYLFFSG